MTVFGILLGFSDVSLASYNLVSNVAGETKLVSYLDAPVAPVGLDRQVRSDVHLGAAVVR